MSFLIQNTCILHRNAFKTETKLNIKQRKVIIKKDRDKLPHVHKKTTKNNFNERDVKNIKKILKNNTQNYNNLWT